MSLIHKNVVFKDLFKEMKVEDEMTVCDQCGYIDCVCTFGAEFERSFKEGRVGCYGHLAY
jgi:hypothetical protein